MSSTRQKEEYLKEIREACLRFNFFDAEDAAKKALVANVSSAQIRDCFTQIVSDACKKWDTREYCLPHLYALTSINEAIHDLLEPHAKIKGKVIIATMGSMHYFGKQIVKCLLMNDGFELYDLGETVLPPMVIEKVKEVKPDIICLSALITVCLPLQKEVEVLLEEEGLRDRVKLLVGGISTSQRWADEMKADGWAQDGVGAVREANRLVKEMKGRKERWQS
jgi:methanogenic corrinoid protein MtbC1